MLTHSCPAGTAFLQRFQLNGTAWLACKDLQRPDGALTLAAAWQAWTQRVGQKLLWVLIITVRIVATIDWRRESGVAL